MESTYISQLAVAHDPAHELRVSAENSDNCILVVSSSPEDQAALARLLVANSCPQYWTSSLDKAVDWLRHKSAWIVICDEHLPDGHWQDLWELLRWTAFPPIFIVTAYWADERLWAEVLNMGAYDVLAKPYRGDEVVRVLDHAPRAVRISALESRNTTNTAKPYLQLRKRVV